ncbi:acyltransferase family protein [Ferribacterium limneticum]|uniref:acyltransferase family protein n=1 Tax=Ferribacterium limneticum TaxID=76259 RepID=UPI001CF82BE7|nr:acyltransferase [Ferribacterium limneticum]UCV24731.1 acyltransferase [Ferribacterium limneticum]
MSRWFSLYLDVIRLMAASFVVYAHTNVRFLTPDPLPLAQFAHSAVTVFFVLSGYVVAFVVDKRENTPSAYIASRSARILSLSILAVLLTPLLDVVGRSATPDLYLKTIPSDYVLLRIVASLAFVAEIWIVSITTFSNVPYWSLNYEVWYYVIFGVYCFCTPSRRWVIIGTICLILGPKVVLMAPCWLAGVFAYRWQVSDEKDRPIGTMLIWTGSLITFWGYHHFDLMRVFSEQFVLSYLGEWTHTQLHFSRYFAADWLLSAIIAANFVAARKIGALLPELKAGTLTWVGFVGGLTYALYIIHFPFVYMWGALLNGWSPGLGKYWAVLGLTLLSVGLVALIGEWLRPKMRTVFDRVLSKQAVGKWSSHSGVERA